MNEEPKIGEDTPTRNMGNAGKGRPKGALNKSTKAFRETINQLLEDNADNVSTWLTDVAASDPAKALDLMSKLAEYAAPKLSRVESSIEHSGEVGIRKIEMELIKPK